MPTPGLVVIVRGPMGAGKTTLMHGLAALRSYHFWVLDSDAATGALPPDPNGEHLGEEWRLECRILGLFARAVLAWGFNVITDPGTLLTKREVDLFLRAAGRRRGDPRVVLFRLGVTPREAARRKTTVRASYVLASNRGWQPTRVAGEIFLDTDGQTADQVLAVAAQALADRVGTDRDRFVPKIRHFPRRAAPERSPHDGAEARVEPYDPKWSRRYSRFERRLRSLLPAARIEHVGSTGVPGMRAKPIIDIGVGLPSATRLRVGAAQTVGLEFRSVSPESAHFVFRDAHGRHAAHVHVNPMDSEPELALLRFRDYLRSHPRVAREYSTLKQTILAISPSLEAYGKAKDPFLRGLQPQVERWARRTRWAPRRTPRL